MKIVDDTVLYFSCGGKFWNIYEGFNTKIFVKSSSKDCAFRIFKSSMKSIGNK